MLPLVQIMYSILKIVIIFLKIPRLDRAHIEEASHWVTLEWYGKCQPKY